jgi:peroxiredoxin
MSALVVGVLLVAGCQGRSAQGAFRPLAIGDAVPHYAARSLSGDSVRVGGDEPPTVLNVWATWCTSCREEMSALDSLRSEFGGRGVRVIGVSVDDGDVERVQRFAAANHLQFTVAHDPAGTIQQTFQVVGVPTTFVIGRDGKLVWQHVGNISDNFADVRTAVARVAARQSTSPGGH